jgi:peptidoglycan/xylan/chitin deacetylase (PgdA/CDA1 family)
MTVVVLMYHAIERGPRPLCIEPELFRSHVAAIAASGVPALTVSELGSTLRATELPERGVAITFDDGYESVVENAVPVLAEHGLKATIFCVAGQLGRTNDWPRANPVRHPFRLASAAELARVGGQGFEIGSHSYTHTALTRVRGAEVTREIEESKNVLQNAVGSTVTSFAWPYGAEPSEEAAQRIAAMYEVACSTEIARVGLGADPYALPRIDAHYLRRTALLRRVLDGALDTYLGLRKIGARVRESVRKDDA